MTRKATGDAASMYRFLKGPEPTSGPTLVAPDCLTPRVWKPTWTRIRPPGQTGPRWAVWWLLHQLRIFKSRDYQVLVLSEPAGRVVHRAVVFPAFFRFPFMVPADVQIGDVFTDPEWRRNGLATWSLQKLVSLDLAPRGSVWYLAEENNEPSQRAATAAGFVPVTSGRRQTWMGIGLTARFLPSL